VDKREHFKATKIQAMVFMMRLPTVALLLSGTWLLSATEVLRWNFDDDINDHGYVLDRSGYDNHGWMMSDTNQITRDTTTKATGVASGSWITNFTQTDGVNIYPASQYLAITNTASPLFGNLTNGSVAFWVRFRHKELQGTTRLFDGINRQTAGATNGWRIGRLVAPHVNQVEMRIHTASTTSSDGDLAVRASAHSVNGTTDTSTAEFRHYVFTWDCTANESKVYTNGVLNATGNTTNAPYLRIAPSPLWLCVGASRHSIGTPEWGDDPYPNDSYHYGWMDDIRMFTRTLTASEVADVFAFSESLPARTIRADTLRVGVITRP
jgi:hypothetical protein